MQLYMYITGLRSLISGLLASQFTGLMSQQNYVSSKVGNILLEKQLCLSI